MRIAKWVYPLSVSLLLGYVYNKYKAKQLEDEHQGSYAMVKHYLLNGERGPMPQKPVIWIHSTYEVNARSWASFASRNTEELNQPYLYLTIKSIIDQNGGDFNICLIDDDSFGKLLPHWAVDLNFVAEPIKSKIRQLALAKLLHTYGGFLLPSSVLCMAPLKGVYDQLTMQKALHNALPEALPSTLAAPSMFVGELLDRQSTSTQVAFFPTNQIMGCLKESSTMGEYINYLEKLISTDFTQESVFDGSAARWFHAKIRAGTILMVPAQCWGAKDADGKPVTIERFLGSTFVHFAPATLGLYIPADEILKRTAYQWFARMSPKQALESNTVLGKHLLTVGK